MIRRIRGGREPLVANLLFREQAKPRDKGSISLEKNVIAHPNHLGVPDFEGGKILGIHWIS